MVTYVVTSDLQYPEDECSGFLQNTNTLKMETAGFFKMLLITYKATQCHSPENHKLGKDY